MYLDLFLTFCLPAGGRCTRLPLTNIISLNPNLNLQLQLQQRNVPRNSHPSLHFPFTASGKTSPLPQPASFLVISHPPAQTRHGALLCQDPLNYTLAAWLARDPRRYDGAPCPWRAPTPKRHGLLPADSRRQRPEGHGSKWLVMGYSAGDGRHHDPAAPSSDTWGHVQPHSQRKPRADNNGQILTQGFWQEAANTVPGFVDTDYPTGRPVPLRATLPPLRRP